MADQTKIEWSDATWNVVTGCTEVSSGCDHCYAKTFAERWRGTPGHHFVNGFDVQLRPERLDLPLKWRKPRKVFVNSMSDLFHEAIPDDFIVQVFARMWWAPQHTFQVLTKRHGRMRSLLPRIEESLRRMEADLALVDAPTPLTWPLPNVWLGVSVEDQKWADIRIPALLETPAAVRFLSCEPLLGPVDLWGPLVHPGHRPRLTYWLDGRPGWGPEETSETGLVTQPLAVGPRIDWVIVGGESGPGARPMHPDWARTIRDQCVHLGVAFHFKQWGAWCPPHPSHGQSVFGHVTNDDACQVVNVDGKLHGRPWGGWGLNLPEAVVMRRYPKGKAGRQLDGRTWDEFPNTTPLEVAHG